MKKLCSSILFLSVLAASALGQTCSPTTFITAATYPAPEPFQELVADFNHDGFPDVATAEYNSGTLAVLINSGNGSFGPPIVTTIQDTVYQFAAADLRGNGTVDLIVTVYSGIGVLLGNGDGTFAAPVYYPATDYYPSSIAVGTFDSGDAIDVAIADGSGQNIDVFPGNGDGTFGTPLATGTSFVVNLVSGDFNGDGKLDLVATNGNGAGTIAFYPGLGDGHFGSPSNFVSGSQPNAIAAGDLDGDGNLDVAVTVNGLISVLLGNGNGTFQAAILYPAGFSSSALALSDFNQDGFLDAVVVDPQALSIDLLPGNGDGSLGPPAAYVLPNQAAGIAVGDLDGDTLPDVVSGDEVDSIVVLRNAGDGVLLGVPSSPLPGPLTYSVPPSIAAGDWNGDGRQDLAWPIQGGSIALVDNVGSGRFVQGQLLSSGPQNQPIIAVAAGDFDGDRKPDLVASDYNDILLFVNQGNGSFAPPQSVISSNAFGTVTAADFTGDGKSDIAVSQFNGQQVILVLPGNGDGTFQAAVQTPVPFDTNGLVAADLDGDGRADLIVAAAEGVFVLLSNGDGTFQPPLTLVDEQGCCYSFWVAVGRFSGTFEDVLVSTQYTDGVSLFPANGDGTFGAPIQIALPSYSAAITAGDYDGDGHDDFAAVSGNQTAYVFLGLGNRRFQSPVAYATTFSPVALVTADFTGSGTPDIAAVSGQMTSTLVNARLGVTVPTPAPVIVGSTATLTAAAAGYGPVEYQWRLEGVPLSEGGRYSGTATSQLTIADAAFSDVDAQYDVMVTDSCTSTVSSPAVGLSVEFADVPPSNIFYADVNAVAAAGIVAGCGGANYCPDAPTTRAQMAVFLLRGEHGSAYVPPPCAGLFADVPCPSLFADWIEQLAHENVTAGCGGGDYCPDSPVTRAQMAVFLLKAHLGSGYAPPPAVGIFGDVPPGSFAADWIEALYNDGITGGCSASPLLYCPSNTVNRGQMAVFIVRTFF